jgi:hypothetical protein
MCEYIDSISVCARWPRLPIDSFPSSLCSEAGDTRYQWSLQHHIVAERLHTSAPLEARYFSSCSSMKRQSPADSGVREVTRGVPRFVAGLAPIFEVEVGI